VRIFPPLLSSQIKRDEIMLREQLEQLRQEYIGRYVTVESDAPELAALRGRLGQVKTINSNGHALIRFEGAHESWHDIEMDCVKVVDEPEPQPSEISRRAPGQLRA